MGFMMEIRGNIVENEYDLSFSGRFTFSDHLKFQKIISVVSGEKKIVKVFIDLSMLEFVDSAALGMILLISDILRERNGHLVLKKPIGQVARILEISQFSKLVNIEK